MQRMRCSKLSEHRNEFTSFRNDNTVLLNKIVCIWIVTCFLVKFHLNKYPSTRIQPNALSLSISISHFEARCAPCIYIADNKIYFMIQSYLDDFGAICRKICKSLCEENKLYSRLQLHDTESCWKI